MQIRFYEKRLRRDFLSSMPQSALDELKAVIDSTADALPGPASTGPGTGLQQISAVVTRFKHEAVSFDGLDVPVTVVEEYARFARLIDELQGLAVQPGYSSGFAARRVPEIRTALEKHYLYLKTVQW